MFMLGTVELPLTINPSTPISDSIILLGGMIGIVVGGYVFFKVVKIGLSWASAALGSEHSFDVPKASQPGTGFLYHRYDDSDQGLFNRITESRGNTRWDNEGVWYDPNEL